MKSKLPFVFRAFLIAFTALGVVFLSGYRFIFKQEVYAPTQKPQSAMRITIPAFAENNSISDAYTCVGQNRNPEVRFSGIPTGAQSLALRMQDPDAPAGTFTHWILFNIPNTATEIPENAAAQNAVPANAKQGINSFGNARYDGPCPPQGQTHRYVFTGYALDTALELPDNTSNNDFEKSIAEHIIAQASFTGTFRKP